MTQLKAAEQRDFRVTSPKMQKGNLFKIIIKMWGGGGGGCPFKESGKWPVICQSHRIMDVADKSN